MYTMIYENGKAKLLSALLALSPLVVFASNSDSINTLPREHKLAIAPRLQWQANYGYCGEVAFISAGLYFGQYVSQYDARSIASKGKNQALEGSQLLIGVNDLNAASKMHLDVEPWHNAGSTEEFLVWVKRNIYADHPVVMGVYMNQSLSEDDDEPAAGQDGYDHIVPVLAASTNHINPTDRGYFGDDSITFSDNGLWNPSGNHSYWYKFKFKDFMATREEANSASRPIYSLARSEGNYGIAIRGIIDKDGFSAPIRIKTDKNYEKPEMVQGSTSRPAWQGLTLTITISDMKPDVKYNVYRYDDLNLVPEQNFNKKARNAKQKWTVTGSRAGTYSFIENIKSNQTVAYRAVPITAP